MYNIETVESLHAYAGRLHRERPAVATSTMPRRFAVRDLVRKVRRTA
jgi:hypothetical protein